MIIKTDQDTIKGFLEDSSGLKGGYAKEVYFPENTGEVTSIIKMANKERVPVTIAGNGTGVTGGRIPFGGIVLSTERLNKIISIKKMSQKNGIAHIQTGVTLKDLKDAANKEGLLYAPDPTEESAFIGGNISTNASGARGYKYGSTRRYIKRLKMVLGCGKVIDIERGKIFSKKRIFNLNGLLDLKIKKVNLPTYNMPHIKNAAGYYIHDNMDLVDLFIGQEGTLSVITEAELELIKNEEVVLSVFTFLDADKQAQSLTSCLKKENVLSIEYFCKNSLKLLKKHFENLPEATAAIFFEKACLKKDEDKTIVEISKMLKKSGVSYDKTWMAQTPHEYKRLKEIRHRLPEVANEIIKQSGFPKVSTDLAVPEEGFDYMFRLYKTVLEKSGIPYIIFGHISECHLHVNIFPSTKKECCLAKELYTKFVKETLRLKGTVSAEHGIGKLKHKYIEMMYGTTGIMEMISLKKNFDPNCILGRGNIYSLYG